MSKLMEAMRKPFNSAAEALTLNGAPTFATSMNALVDLFFYVGGSRQASVIEHVNMFDKAYIQDKRIALQILLWSRDVRGGAGERNFYRNIMSHLRSTNYNLYKHMIDSIAEYGCWSDMFKITQRPTDLELLKMNYRIQTDPLAAKWFPRKGSWFNLMRRYGGYTPKELRKILVTKSTTVEQQLCARKFDTIEYSHVPSIAFKNYTNTFKRHTPDRFENFLNLVKSGEAKINASAIFPYDVLRGSDPSAMDAQWNSLPNYLEGNTERILPMCDVSGSMFQGGIPSPIEVCVSLGLYIAERNEGPFHNQVLTFSAEPELIELVGDNIFEKQRNLQRADWGMNTDIIHAFWTILNRAHVNKVAKTDMPTTILIFSDMEFDGKWLNGGSTAYEEIKQEYESKGYELPKIVFWNLNGREGNVPVRATTENVALVSGCSPAVVKSVLAGKNITPVSVMLEAVDNDRYRKYVQKALTLSL
jgi:hypothetical protein